MYRVSVETAITFANSHGHDRIEGLRHIDRFAMDENCRDSLLQLGALKPLVDAVYREQGEGRLLAIHSLSRIVFGPNPAQRRRKMAVLRGGGANALSSVIIEKMNDSICQQALEAMWSICCCKEASVTLLNNNASVQKLLDSVMEILSDLSAPARNRVSAAGLLHAMTHFSTVDTVEDFRRHTAAAVGAAAFESADSAASDTDMHIDSTKLDQLCPLSRSAASAEARRRQLVEAGVLEAAIRVLNTEPPQEVWIHAAVCAGNLALSPAHWRRLRPHAPRAASMLSHAATRTLQEWVRSPALPPNPAPPVGVPPRSACASPLAAGLAEGAVGRQAPTFSLRERERGEGAPRGMERAPGVSGLATIHVQSTPLRAKRRSGVGDGVSLVYATA